MRNAAELTAVDIGGTFVRSDYICDVTAALRPVSYEIRRQFPLLKECK